MAITRRELLVKGSASLALSAALRGRAQSRAGRKPNLLFLIADDHARYVLRCQGNPRAVTPNFDRLASEGVRFASHYCNAPVCTPSRQSILTGQLPHSAGVTVLSTPLAEDKPTLAKQLDAAGYTTAVYGKMHFNRPGRPGLPRLPDLHHRGPDRKTLARSRRRQTRPRRHPHQAALASVQGPGPHLAQRRQAALPPLLRKHEEHLGR